MKQWQRGHKVKQKFETQKDGKPWRVILSCLTFEKADSERNHLLESWKEASAKSDVKVKRSKRIEMYTVRTRAHEVAETELTPEKKVTVDVPASKDALPKINKKNQGGTRKRDKERRAHKQ